MASCSAAAGSPAWSIAWNATGCFAAITPKGRELFSRARQTHLDGVRKRFLSRFTRDELRTLAALWSKLEPGP